MSTDLIYEGLAFENALDWLSEQFDSQVRDLKALLQTKGEDYSGIGAEHTWMNFVFAAEFSELSVEDIFYARLGEKIGRLHSTILNRKVYEQDPNHEGEDQVLIDIAGYMVLLVAWHRYNQLKEQS